MTKTTKMTTALPTEAQGWMIETANGQRTRYRGISQAGAFAMARQNGAVWARRYAIVGDVTFVEV